MCTCARMCATVGGDKQYLQFTTAPVIRAFRPRRCPLYDASSSSTKRRQASSSVSVAFRERLKRALAVHFKAARCLAVRAICPVAMRCFHVVICCGKPLTNISKILIINQMCSKARLPLTHIGYVFLFHATIRFDSDLPLNTLTTEYII